MVVGSQDAIITRRTDRQTDRRTDGRHTATQATRCDNDVVATDNRRRPRDATAERLAECMTSFRPRHVLGRYDNIPDVVARNNQLSIGFI